MPLAHHIENVLTKSEKYSEEFFKIKFRLWGSSCYVGSDILMTKMNIYLNFSNEYCAKTDSWFGILG